jgi:SAM-dependent methyltransferase
VIQGLDKDAAEKMNFVKMHPTRCPISGEQGDVTEIYPANLSTALFSPAVFSARRPPDRIHYRIVRSNRSGLVRSDPIADLGLIYELYAQSSFDYAEEIPYLKKSYERYLERVCALGCEKRSLLEIGCGNGFFLEQAHESGFRDVRGIEPSRDAVNQAPPNLRHRIVCEIMRPGTFEPEQFDAICMFQTFDHIPDPNELLDECQRILRPGGFILSLNHNVKSWSARLLGERSPIIDIEHTFLYSPSTMRLIFEANHFKVIEQGCVWNTYSLSYLFHLIPLPRALKRIGLHALKASALGSLPLTVPLGNLYLIAKKPTSPGHDQSE